MGLDMYLIRKIYIDHRDLEGILAIKSRGKQIPLDLNKINYIEEATGYWRKANQIHKWFVDNIQDGRDDCGHYDVELDDLQELLETCKKVKEKAIMKESQVQVGNEYNKDTGDWDPIYKEGKIIENAEEIEKILPTQSGCFFGLTNYDEFYMQDIEDTIKIIEEQIKREVELKELGIFTYLQYHASW